MNHAQVEIVESHIRVKGHFEVKGRTRVKVNWRSTLILGAFLFYRPSSLNSLSFIIKIVSAYDIPKKKTKNRRFVS